MAVRISITPALLLLSCLAPEPFGSLEVRVERVIDGDTITCEGLGSVRLLCIDTPERGEDGETAWMISARR